MSNPIKSFTLSGNLVDGTAELKINCNYADIYSGVWQLSLVDFHVIASQNFSENLVLTISTNQVTGTSFDSRGQPCTKEVTIRSVGLSNKTKLNSFNLGLLWFTVNLPSNLLKVNLQVIQGKNLDLKAKFTCTLALQRVT